MPLCFAVLDIVPRYSCGGRGSFFAASTSADVQEEPLEIVMVARARGDTIVRFLLAICHRTP